MCRRAEMSDVLHAIIVGNGTTGYAARGEQSIEERFFATHSRFKSRPRIIKQNFSHNQRPCTLDVSCGQSPVGIFMKR